MPRDKDTGIAFFYRRFISARYNLPNCFLNSIGHSKRKSKALERNKETRICGEKSNGKRMIKLRAAMASAVLSRGRVCLFMPFCALETRSDIAQILFATLCFFIFRT